MKSHLRYHIVHFPPTVSELIFLPNPNISFFISKIGVYCTRPYILGLLRCLYNNIRGSIRSNILYSKCMSLFNLKIRTDDLLDFFKLFVIVFFILESPYLTFRHVNFNIFFYRFSLISSNSFTFLSGTSTLLSTLSL